MEDDLFVSKEGIMEYAAPVGNESVSGVRCMNCTMKNDDTSKISNFIPFDKYKVSIV